MKETISITLRKEGRIVERREVVRGDELRLEAFTITIDESAGHAGPLPTVEVAQLWGDSLLDVVRVRAERVRIGGERGCVLFAPREALPGESFPLVACEGGRACVQVLERFGLSIDGAPLATLIAEGRAIAVREGRLPVWRVPLAEGERARVDVGGMTFLVRPVLAERAVPANLRFDAPFLGVLALLSVFVMGAYAIMRAAPQPSTSVAERVRNDDTTFVFLPPPSPTATPKNVRPPLLARVIRERQDPDAGEGGRVVGREGVRGKRDATAENGGRRRAGALDALADLNDLFGGGRAKALGADAVDLIGDDSVADRRGSGFGMRDDGPGGGGQYLTIDGGGERGRGRGKKGDGKMPGVPGEKRYATPEIENEEVVMRARLDPKLVEAAIARHLDSIRACYERRLYARSDLAGKVVVQFEIAGTGRVARASVSHSSLGDRAAEACVVERVQQIQFPGFAAAGTVSIVYPFLFKTAGN